MVEYRLVRKHKISRRNSHDMILAFAYRSNHYHNINFKTDADVKRAFEANGHNYGELVETCRNFAEKVPIFENLIGSTFTVTEGVKASRVNMLTGKEDIEVQGPGTITMSTYMTIYETASSALERAISKISYAELQVALVEGMASIESYINYRADLWNSTHADNKLVDSKAKKICFEDKIDVWVPIMTGGKSLNKGFVNWSDFKKLRIIRDDLSIHPKTSGYSISYVELASCINMFKTGVAGVLMQLHEIFDEKVPAIIIRGFFVPDVIVEKIEV